MVTVGVIVVTPGQLWLHRVNCGYTGAIVVTPGQLWLRTTKINMDATIKI